MKKLKRIPKHNLGNRLLKSVVKSTAKAFNPTIKDYSSKTDMFLDILDQAKQQKIPVDRSSKLYQQIVDEVPEAKKYYKNLNLPDEQLADGLYLSTKTKQAQKGLADSKVQDLVYHGTGSDFKEFSKDAFFTGEGAMIHGAGFYTTPNKKIAEHYADLASNTNKKSFIKSKDLKNLEQESLTKRSDLDKLIKKYYPETLNSKKLEIGVYRKLDDAFSSGDLQDLPKELINAKIDAKLQHKAYLDLYKKEMINGEKLVIKKSVMPLLSKMKSPVDTASAEFNYISSAENPLVKTKYLSEKGFDSVIHRPGNDAHYIPYEPTQLKSLFREHLGKWDWNNPNIHKAIGAGVLLGAGSSQLKQGGKIKLKFKKK